MKKAFLYGLSLAITLSLVACSHNQTDQQISEPDHSAASSQADVSTPKPEPEPPVTPAPEPKQTATEPDAATEPDKAEPEQTVAEPEQKPVAQKPTSDTLPVTPAKNENTTPPKDEAPQEADDTSTPTTETPKPAEEPPQQQTPSVNEELRKAVEEAGGYIDEYGTIVMPGLSSASDFKFGTPAPEPAEEQPQQVEESKPSGEQSHPSGGVTFEEILKNNPGAYIDEDGVLHTGEVVHVK